MEAGAAMSGAKKRPDQQGDATPYMAVARPKGLIEAGNLPIWNRPGLDNGDGTHSSEYSISFEDEHGREVLVPTMVNGKFLTPDGRKPAQGSRAEKTMFSQAWHHYLQTGEHLGMFDNPDNADAYAQILHNRGPVAPANMIQPDAPPAWAQKPGAVPEPKTTDDLNAAGQAAIAKLPPQLRRLIADKQIKFVQGASDQRTYKNGADYTSVEAGSPDTIYVNNRDAFLNPKQTPQLVAHEVLHLVQNNVHPTVQSQMPEDDHTDPYNFGGEAGLAQHRAQGGTLWTLPREKAAAAMQYYVSQADHADPARRAQLDKVYSPYLNDLANVPRANIESTPDSATTLNTKPNAPLPPPETTNGQ